MSRLKLRKHWGFRVVAFWIIAQFMATQVHAEESNIEHDAEYYILYNQNKDKWVAEDKTINKNS